MPGKNPRQFACESKGFIEGYGGLVQSCRIVPLHGAARPLTKGGRVMSRKNTQQSSTSIIDRFETFGNHGVWVVLGIAALMTAWVYWDFLTAAKVLLYKDIGSDSINIFYPHLVQAAKIYKQYGSSSGFSMEFVMGGSVGFNKYDPFAWLTLWGGPASIARNLAFVEIVKLLCTTVLGFFFFRNQSYANITSAIGALCFGFSGYVVLGASGWYVHSAQVMYIVAMLWVVEYGLAKKPFFYVLVPLTTVYIASFIGYLLVYVTAALLLYIPIRTFTTLAARDAMKLAGVMLGLFIVGLALSYNVFTGVVSMVTSSGRAESIKAAGAASAYGTKMNVSIFDFAPRAEYSNVVLRAYSNNTMGTGNGFRGMMNYLEAPLLYYGLPMLVFLPFFFVGQNRRTRITYGVLLGGVLAMLVFPWFRFAFWGFNLDYFREFTMLIGAVLLILAMRGLNTFVTTSNKTYSWLAPVSALVIAMLPFVLAKPASLIDPSQKSSLVLLVLSFGGLTTAYALTKRNVILVGLLLVTAVDLGLNAHTTINMRDVLSTREIEQGMLYGGSSLKAIDWIKAQQAGVYRVVKFNPSGPTMHSSLNDAMVQGYSGIVGYLSFHNKYFLRAMEAFGCRDPKNPSQSKWVFQAMMRPFLASALGVKYFLVNDRPMGFSDQLFPPIKQIDNVFIHESKTALPVLVAYDRYITEDEFRTQTNGRNDYMLYKAAIVGTSAVADVGPAVHYDLQADTVRVVSPLNFVEAAAERTGMMSVSAQTTQKGIEATIDLKRAAVVVITIPYDESFSVTIDGQPVKTFVADFGFIGFTSKAGSRKIVLQQGA